MTVDLVESDREGRVIKSFIELKAQSNKSDNPLSAMCEVVMYYSLFKKVRERAQEIGFKLPRDLADRGFSLVVLAPKRYYNYFHSNNEKNDKLLKRISTEMTKSLNIKCQYRKIGIDCHASKGADMCLENIAVAYRAKPIK